MVLLSAQPSLAWTQASPKTKAEKIANAMTAAPAAIAQEATIKDWPAKEGGELQLLRQGSSDWVCLPDDPNTRGNDPMCLDPEWQKAIVAVMNKRPIEAKRAGIGYMLSTNAEGSNTDPFATKPTPDNQWHKTGPHIMIVVPDANQLAGIPRDPKSGGPYVMFNGTPWAHIMVPVKPAH
ncbi:MAG TPA: hypothetical protein VHH32_02585 [Gemmatimonadales bacterium]|nr:hypothetical protein [Gemmatimonadales bacterium]